MGDINNIKNLLYKTIHRNPKTIDMIADEMGVSSNSLYRYCLDGESGADLPLKRLIPLMKSTRDYSILKHIAYLCGFVCVKIPKFKKVKGDFFDIVNDYQESTTTAAKELKRFFDNPCFENYEKATAALKDVTEKSVSNHAYCTKIQQGQLEMDL